MTTHLATGTIPANGPTVVRARHSWPPTRWCSRSARAVNTAAPTTSSRPERCPGVHRPPQGHLAADLVQQPNGHTAYTMPAVRGAGAGVEPAVPVADTPVHPIR